MMYYAINTFQAMLGYMQPSLHKSIKTTNSFLQCISQILLIRDS